MAGLNRFSNDKWISNSNTYINNRLKTCTDSTQKYHRLTKIKPKDKNVDISLCLLSVALAGLASSMLMQNSIPSSTSSNGRGGNRRKREVHNYN